MSRRQRAHGPRRPHQHEAARRRARQAPAPADPAADNPLVPLLRPALRDRDVTAFWVAASPLVPMLSETQMPGHLPEGVDLLQTFIEIDIAETTALLHMVAALSPDQDFQRRARAALSARRQPMPPQVEGISQAAVGSTTMFGDSAGDNLMLEILLPRAVRAVLVVYIERHPLPYVKDAFVVDAPLRQIHADYRRIMGEEGYSLDDELEILAPAQAGAYLSQALEATPSAAQASEGSAEQWPMLRPFVEFVRHLLPAEGPGYGDDGSIAGAERRGLAFGGEPVGSGTDPHDGADPDGGFDPYGGAPPWILADGTDLVEEFLASEQARPLDQDDAVEQLVMFLFLVASGATGDPLDWTPELGEWVAGEMLPTNPVLSQEAMDQVPSVLPALITWAHARTGTAARQSHAVLDVTRPLLEELPARYAEPRNRARRLEEHIEFALETGDPDELRRADLAMRVGGYEELETLDDAPLPAEPLLLEGIADDLHERLGEIDAHLVTGLDRVTEGRLELDGPLFGDEFRTACRRLLARIARIEPAVLRRKANTRITAGTLAWIIGRGNDLVGHPPAPVRSGDLLRAFDINGSPSQRSDTLMRAAALPRSMVGLALDDAELLVASARQDILRTRAVLDDD